jgi:hypothetical protein
MTLKTNAIKWIFWSSLLFFLFISCGVKGQQQQTILLPELNHPYDLYVHEGRLFVTDCEDEEKKCTLVLIYSLKDYTFQFKIGGNGKIPGKYTVSPGHSVWIGFQPDNWFINDFSKIGFYNREGKFIKETLTEKGSVIYRAVGKRFVAQGSLRKDGIAYYTVDLYDEELKKIEEIYRLENPYNPRLKKSRVLTRGLLFRGYDKNIYIKGGSEDFVIDVFDSAGSHIRKIQHPYVREKVTDDLKQEIYNKYRNHPLFGKYYDVIKDEIVFPEYLPAIASFRVTDNRLYVLTYKRINNESEFYILDLNGRVLEKVLVPFVWNRAYYPQYAISDRKLYQLRRSKNTNQWELISNPIASVD